MSGTIKLSQLSLEILEDSKTIGLPVNGYTAERFLISAIRYIRKTDFSSADVDKQAKDLKKYINSLNIDIESVEHLLIIYVNMSDTPSIDKYYFDTVKDKAEYFAGRRHIDEITPDLITECIVKAPSGIIKTALKYTNKIDSGEEKPDTDFFDDLLGDVLSIDIDDDDEDLLVDFDDSTEIDSDNTQTNDKNPRLNVVELTRQIKEISDTLRGNIFGQDKAINTFAAGYFQAKLLELTQAKKRGPFASFLFAGPPGTGKTFLCETIADVLKLPFKRFDMSEYCDKEASVEFCGSDKVYSNGKKGNFTSYVEENPRAVVLFDEIEKAHITIIYQFLQMLDAGVIRDNYTDTVIPLHNVVMFFTTNAGKQLYEEASFGNFSDVSRKVIIDALKNDINPQTKEPYFPSAICSRFASGNVVMFNHISAYDLHKIAIKEIEALSDSFKQKYGINVEVDPDIYSALLFSEGGSIDARVMKSRANALFTEEFFELLRLDVSDNGCSAFNNIENLRYTLSLPQDNNEIVSLFKADKKQDVLIFADTATANKLRKSYCGNNARILLAKDEKTANKMIADNDISCIVIDFTYGADKNSKYMNFEDNISVSRSFYRSLKQQESDIPVYMLQTKKHIYTNEELVSYFQRGIRNIIDISENIDNFTLEADRICINNYQQNSILLLGKSGKVLKYETAQCLEDDGKTAVIRLFDFKLANAINIEDSKDIIVSKPNVRYDDIIGSEDAKKELRYFGDFLKHPKKYAGTGVKTPKGVLLYGPPGTGKTMLAKAMATEADVTFIATEGNSFLKDVHSSGAESVHRLFTKARKYAPSVIFIDEIDAIAKERNGISNTIQGDILTALLTEMDGFNSHTKKPVFVLAATNFDVEPGKPKSLDGALMRRFDRRIFVDLPDLNERTDYIRLLISKNKLFKVSDTQIENIAVRSAGMSPAELESVFEMALRTAVRQELECVSDATVEEAFELFNNGEENNRDSASILRTARHEVGHAFLCHNAGGKPSYVTIVSRGNHGGYMQQGDTEGKSCHTTIDILARIRTALGGRAAEIVYYGDADGITAGASSDLEIATSLARSMVCRFGMVSEFGLGVVEPEMLQNGSVFLEVQKCVNNILHRELDNAIGILKENKKTVDKIVEKLIQKNKLTEEEINKIFSK